jgi:hypothetical protein
MKLGFPPGFGQAPSIWSLQKTDRLGHTRQGFEFGTRFHLPAMIRRQLQDVAMELEQGGSDLRADRQTRLAGRALRA